MSSHIGKPFCPWWNYAKNFRRVIRSQTVSMEWNGSCRSGRRNGGKDGGSIYIWSVWSGSAISRIRSAACGPRWELWFLLIFWGLGILKNCQLDAVTRSKYTLRLKSQWTLNCGYNRREHLLQLWSQKTLTVGCSHIRFSLALKLADENVIMVFLLSVFPLILH